MKQKAKACKGINKASGYKGCGTMTMYRKYGLCSSCLRVFYLSDERGRIIVKKATIKAQSKRIKQQAELKKAFENKKTRSALQRAHNNTKKVVHEAVRLRDKGKNCISCGALWNTIFKLDTLKKLNCMKH